MISADYFVELLKSNGIDFFCGVPDSLLKEFCACVLNTIDENHHFITANEGGAIGLATGHYLGTGEVPMVYLQNSGLGNIVNPVLSLADSEVYGIPMLLLIGWRGEPGRKDEPQHIKQGRVMLPLLEAMEVPYVIIDKHTNNIEALIPELLLKAKSQDRPIAIVARAGTFSKYEQILKIEQPYSMNRETAIEVILNALPENSVIVSTTGKTSREVFEYRSRNQQEHNKDFLTVGSMGHASMIALGIAKSTDSKRVVCIDGDGASLMHLGALPIIGLSKVQNLIHVVINNGAHESVGGQPTVGFQIDFCKIAETCGYAQTVVADTPENLKDILEKGDQLSFPLFIEVRVKMGSRPDLGRPTTTPKQNKSLLMDYLKK